MHGFSGTSDELIADRTLVHSWLGRWSANPTVIVAIAPDGTAWTAAQFDAATQAMACCFIEVGLVPGDRVLMSCTPSIELILVHIAVLRAGLVAVPVNTAFTAEELANIVAAASPAFAVLSDLDRWRPNTAISAALLNDFVLASASLSGAQLDMYTDDLLRREAQLDSDSPALLLYTSGTTGIPKGALLSHGNALASAEALRISWQWTTDDVLVLCLPLFHMHGLGVGVHGSLHAGARIVVLPAFEETAVFNALAEHHATLLFGVPTMWVRLAASPRVAELRSLRLCVSGSAPLANLTWESLAEMGGQQVVERYGMTETVMLTSNPVVGERRPGSVGGALPGVEVRIDVDHSATTKSDGIGEIVVRGPNVFGGYLNRPDANDTAFTTDGFFRTGDLGRIDDHGYVTIVGRSKDLIITGGYNVYPSDIESVLRRHPLVVDAAVVGEPSELWGETVTAVVVFATAQLGGATPIETETIQTELLEFAAQHLAPYQRPRRILVRESLPRNALGKVLRQQLLLQD
jgi:malonyl-CoA/methylmalonyl-CoA synthetase